MKCLVAQYLGSDISKEFPIEYEEMKRNVIGYIINFYKSLSE